MPFRIVGFDEDEQRRNPKVYLPPGGLTNDVSADTWAVIAEFELQDVIAVLDLLAKADVAGYAAIPGGRRARAIGHYHPLRGLDEVSPGRTPAEVLTMATSTNAELLAMSGPRNPYSAPLAVIRIGALADLILVDGNPLQNLDLIATPRTSFTAIMKNGELVEHR